MTPCITVVSAGQAMQKIVDTTPDVLPPCVRRVVFPDEELTLTDENVTQQFHHWLKYIVMNYDDLDEYTLFLSANPNKHTRFLSLEDLFKVMRHEPSYFCDVTAWAHILKCDGEGKPHHPGLPVNLQFERYFPEIRVPKVFEFVYGGNELMSKRRLQSRPRTFYETLLLATEKKELDLNTLERLWHQF